MVEVEGVDAGLGLEAGHWKRRSMARWSRASSSMSASHSRVAAQGLRFLAAASARTSLELAAHGSQSELLQFLLKRSHESSFRIEG